MKTKTQGFAALALPLLFGSACDAIDVFIPVPDVNGPAGILEGIVTYSGPPPCTQDGRIVGAAVLLGFNVSLLPPPDGLGASAGGFSAVIGETLFDGVRQDLVFNGNGARWCPDAAAPAVTVSGTWAMGPFPAGEYQVRGFYDRDGDFDPSYSISNLPSRGDIGGGAVENPVEAAAGAKPRYRVIPLGDRQANGSLVIPETGSHVGGVTVTLGLELPLDRPVFYAKSVKDVNGANTDATKVVVPADVELKKFSTADPTGTEASFIELTLGAGVPDEEKTLAGSTPFDMPVADGDPCIPGSMVNAPCFLYTRQDVNGDGVIDTLDVVPEGSVASLFPLAIFTKLGSGRLGNQGSPAVLLQGLTIYKSLLQTAIAPTTLVDASKDLVVALRPAVLCIDPADASRPATLLTARKTDSEGNPLLSDEAGVKEKLKAQFGREIEVAYGCLPKGEYAMNVIYETGQAWTVPNEGGVCAASEAVSSDGRSCGKRAILSSQNVVVTIGDPVEAAYCVANPTPPACLPH